jgi:hypothetical protein
VAYHTSSSSSKKTGNIRIKRNIEARSCNDYCRGKAKNIKYTECVFVVVVIQHAKRMRHIIFSSVACPSLPYFSTLSHKQHDFRENKVLDIKNVFRFSLKLLSTSLTLGRIQQGLHLNYQLLFKDCN